MANNAPIPGSWLPQGGYSAFVPMPLPPEIPWTSRLVRLLSEADRAVGRLACESGRPSNPMLLPCLFARYEAIHSGKLARRPATLAELLAAEAGIAVAGSPDELREAENGLAALHHGLQWLKVTPIGVQLLKELHEILLAGVPNQPARPGEFRKIQNLIGRPGCTPATAAFVPPPPELVESCLTDWEKFLHESDLPPLVLMALAHYQFEAIHPFLEGNGRVGRLLISLFLVERSLLPAPVLYLSAFFEASPRDYSASLRGVSAHGAWVDWLAYFLTGVACTAEDALHRARQLEAIQAEWRQALAGESNKTPQRIVDLLATNPFLTAKGGAEKLAIAFTTAQRAIERLEVLGIVQQTSPGKRDRVYCAQALLAILETPARWV